jgi:hypothetical protein
MKQTTRIKRWTPYMGELLRTMTISEAMEHFNASYAAIDYARRKFGVGDKRERKPDTQEVERRGVIYWEKKPDGRPLGALENVLL